MNNTLLDDWFRIEQERIKNEYILMKIFLTECCECTTHGRWT